MAARKQKTFRQAEIVNRRNLLDANVARAQRRAVTTDAVQMQAIIQGVYTKIPQSPIGSNLRVRREGRGTLRGQPRHPAGGCQRVQIDTVGLTGLPQRQVFIVEFDNADIGRIGVLDAFRRRLHPINRRAKAAVEHLP